MNPITVDEAILEVKRYGNLSNQKPVLVAVCGEPNAGKNHFCSRAMERFRQMGSQARTTTALNIYGLKGKMPDNLEYLFFDVTTDAPDKAISDHVKRVIQLGMGRNPDVTVAMYGPKIPTYSQEELKELCDAFDFVVANSEARRK